MSAIKEHYPRLYKFVTNPDVQTLLVLIAIGLFVDIVMERRVEPPKHESTEISKPVPAPGPSGPATSTGDQSPAVSGSGNTIDYGSDRNKKAADDKASTTKVSPSTTKAATR